jgi:O-antigen ligase
VGLRRLVWYLLIFSLSLTDLFFFPLTLHNAGQPSTFLVIILWFLVVMGWMLSRQIDIPRDYVSKSFYWFVLWMILSIALSYRLPYQYYRGDLAWDKSVRQVLHFFVSGSVFLLPLIMVRTRREFGKAMNVYLSAFFLTVGYGILEYVNHYLHLGVGTSIMEALHYSSWYSYSVEQTVLFRSSFGDIPRLRLLAFEPSMAANYLICMIPFFFANVLIRRSSKNWVILGTSLLLLLLTFSLGGTMSLVAEGIVFLLLVRKTSVRGRIIALAALLIACAMAFAPTSQMIEALILRATTADVSVEARSLEAEVAWNTYRMHPVVGVGIGNSPFYIPQAMPTWALTPWNRRRISPYIPGYSMSGNNMFLRMGAELGTVGLFLFLLWHWRMWRCLWDVYRSTIASDDSYITAAFIATLAGILVGYLGNSGFDKKYWFFLFGMGTTWVRILTEERVLLRQMAARRREPERVSAGAAS